MARPKRTAEERAYKRAVRLLAASAKSEGRVRERLAAAGFEAGPIDEAVARLRASGAINDADLAARVVEQSRAKNESAALTAKRLAAKGVDAAVPKASDAERARTAAEAALGRVLFAADVATRYRRVLAALARKGFDEELALEVAREVIGEDVE